MSDSFPPPAPAYTDPQQPQPQQSQQPAPPARQGHNGLSIAAFVLSLIGGSALAIGLGIAGLIQARKQNQKRGLAIAALVISGIWLVVIIIAAIAAFAMAPERDENGALTSGGTASVTSLKTGDCLNGIKEGVVTNVAVVPCAEPHDGEVVGVHALTGATFPGTAAVEQAANEECVKLLEAYAGEKAAAVDLMFLQPLAETWSLDKNISCIATQKVQDSGSIKK